MHRSLIVEFIGTFFLCLVASLPHTDWAMAGTLTALTYAVFHISGAHFNPAITVAVFLRGKISQAEGIRYLIAQAVAAIAAVLIAMVWYSKGATTNSITTKLFFQSLIGESLGVFALAFVYLSVTSSKSSEGNSFYGFAIGLVFLAMGSTFGAVLNPSVAISQVLLQNAHAAALVTSLVGSAIGAFGAAFVYNLIHGEKLSVPLAASQEIPPTQL